MIDQTSMEKLYVKTNGIQLNVVAKGNPRDPMVVFLHGFPEFWFGWRKQIDDFVSKGYFVVVPNQRGYHLSNKPRGRWKYRINQLAKDVLGLLDHFHQKKAIVIGHDWGGAVAWYLATFFPESVEKLIVLNCPHPLAFRKNLFRNLRQLRKSWYMFFFQCPFLPEFFLRKGDWTFLVQTLLGTSSRGTFSEEEIDQYKEAWREPRAITAMVNWYRAMFFPIRRAKGFLPLRTPALLLWGEKDIFLGKEFAQPSIDLCQKGRVEYFEDATHWIQHEKAKEVNSLMLHFLQESP